MNKIALFAALAVATAATPAFAQATDGKLSEDSSIGKLSVTTVIPKMVRISGLEDMAFNVTADSVANEGGAISKTQKFCVYSNDTVDGLYKLSVEGLAGDELNTGEAKFALTGDTGNTLSIAVFTSDNAAHAFNGTAAPGVARSFKTTSGGQTRPTNLSCNGVENAAMAVKITNKRILAAIAGSYTGTLTLTVSPI
jgi:hypothetical protein